MKEPVFFKKADIFLFLVLVLLGVLSVFAVRSSPVSQPGTAVITVDGKLYGRYSLSIDRQIEVRTQYGFNTVTISSGSVCVTDSDCPGHDCERFGAISNPRQVILCIPHRLCITIEGATDIDAFSY